jgi:hypothetical protein
MTSHAELLLGGGPPVITIIVGAVSRARASAETAVTVAHHRPSRITAAGLSWTVSTTVGEQNGNPLASRSRMREPCCVWYPLARARSSPHWQPWPLPGALFHRCHRVKQTTLMSSYLEPTAKIRSQNIPSF